MYVERPEIVLKSEQFIELYPICQEVSWLSALFTPDKQMLSYRLNAQDKNREVCSQNHRLLGAYLDSDEERS